MNAKRIFSTLVFVLGCAAAASAYTGVSVSTPYPSVSISGTELITLDLTIKGYDIDPQRVNLTVHDVPDGWEHVFVGGGGVVDAVFAEPEVPAEVQLWLEPAHDIQPGSYDILIEASSRDYSYTLPVTVTIGEILPQRLTLESEIPSVRGTPDSDFTFNLELTNNSTSEVLVNLDAIVPEGFFAEFSKKYGSDSIATIPVEAGKTEELKVTITPAQGISRGNYTAEIRAQSESAQSSTQLSMEVTGQAELSLEGPGGILSGSAVAGKQSTFDITVKNTGSAAAENISLASSSPSNWLVEFEPESIEILEADESRKIKALVTPSSEALTGDYNITLRANSDQGRISEKFRITVKTSSLWGIIAVVIIAAALFILVLTMRKYGRR
jgi:uncharacterized membrane protein